MEYYTPTQVLYAHTGAGGSVAALWSNYYTHMHHYTLRVATLWAHLVWAQRENGKLGSSPAVMSSIYSQWQINDIIESVNKPALIEKHKTHT